jgi:hypothetical protein
MEDIARLNEDDLAECMLAAAIQGRTNLMKVLIGQRGPIPVNFVNTPFSPDRFELNGRRLNLDTNYQLKHITSAAELKALFSAIVEFDLKGLIEPGDTFPLLLRDIDKTVRRDWVKGGLAFSGLLPELRNDQLGHPELAIALNEASASEVAPLAYKPVLCWASPDMVDQFPGHLAPLEPFQHFKYRDPITDGWTTHTDPDNPAAPIIITVGVSATRKNAEFADYLFPLMAPEITRMGFEGPAGRVLCETTTDFLLGFPVVNPSADNGRVAKAFVDDYCPFEIMAVQAATICSREFDHEVPRYEFAVSLRTRFQYGDNRLFEMLSLDHPLRDQVLNMMSKEQWRLLVKEFDSTSFTAKSLLALRDTFGIDNTGMSLKLTLSMLLALKEAGYRFCDDTRAFENRGRFEQHLRSNTDKSQNLVMLNFSGRDWHSRFDDQLTGDQKIDCIIAEYQKILPMNLWTSESEKPTDVASALRILSDYDGETYGTHVTLYAYLRTAGIEACMQAAAPEHWKKLMDVFPKEDFKPYLKTMPKNARGMLLEHEIGL